MKITLTALTLIMTSTGAMAVNSNGVDKPRTIGPVTYNEPTSEYGTGNGQNFVALPSPTNGTNGTDGTDGAAGAKGDKGDRGNDGTNGTNGTDGANGLDGANGNDGAAGSNGIDGRNGTNGTDGATGTNGIDGTDGDRGADGVGAVAPLGSLSFSAASSSFYGDGMGFGLSDSNYGDLEGSVVFGFDLNNDWRVVAGITTDFKGKTAGSVGVGVSF